MMKICPNCKIQQKSQHDFCTRCGTQLQEIAEASPTPMILVIPQTKILPLFLLCFFLGYIGIHRFMVGKIGTGILWILTGGFCGIAVLVDLIMLACGYFTDKDGHTITEWT